MKEFFKEELIYKLEFDVDNDDLVPSMRKIADDACFQLHSQESLSDEVKKYLIQIIIDNHDTDIWHEDKKMNRAWKEALVELGGVKEVTKEDMDNRVSTGRKYWFKYKGVCYE